MAEWTKWRRLQTRRTEIAEQIVFLQECRDRNITPQSAQIRMKLTTHKSRKIMGNCSRKLLSAMIQDKRTTLDQISYDSYLAHLKLAKTTHAIEMDKLVTRMHYTMIKLQHSCKNKLRKKFNGLMKRQNNRIKNVTDVKCEPKPVEFHNLANIVLTPEEKDAIELGPKFCFKQPINNKKIITELEDIITAIPVDHRASVREKMADALGQQARDKNRSEARTRKILRELKNKANVSIIKTDKSNQIAIIDTNIYNQKLQAHIDTNNCKKVKRDPTQNIKNQLTKILKDKDFPEEIASQISTTGCSSVPKLFGRVKVHKEGHPIRPVVARCSAPTYKLEQVLTKLIAPSFENHPYMVKSTKQVIDKLKEVQITPDCKMYSLDVTSLFPSTPTDLALDLISKRLIKEEKYTINQISAIMKGLRLITGSNYFQHKGNLYLQMTGAPMGSPISALLAEVVLQHIEEMAFNKLNKTPKMFCRYVDDCLIILAGDQKIAEIHEALESVNTHIKYTIEEEVKSQIPFLDLHLTRHHNHITHKVYRKPTAPPQIIRNDSTHPSTYKQAAFRWFGLRAESHCSTNEQLQEEKEFIYKIGKDHGYEEYEIPKYRKISREGTRLKTINDKKVTKYKAMSYVPRLSEKISNIVRKYDVTVAHVCKNNVFNIIRKDRDDTPQLEKPGIYKVPITDSNNQVINNYLGLSSRKITERITEHRKDLEKGRTSNAIVKFCMENNKARPNWKEVELVASLRKKMQISLREGLEIQYAQFPLCNLDPGVIIPNIWNRFLGPKTYVQPT